MKYKNYRNAYTNDNRIYSYTDISEMPLREIFTRKQELLSQYRVLGIPTEQELKGSENVVHVEAYTREDGTEVKAHYRSKPNSGSGTSRNNDIKAEEENIVKSEPQKEENSENQKQETTEQEQTETTVDKRLCPDEIAGVKRGEPKSFEQMMQQGVNPNYMGDEDINGRYSENCACCTVTAELVIRGYDVEAGPADNPIAYELSSANKSAYLDPETGKECVPEKIDINNVDCFNHIDQTVKQGERYEFSYYTQRDLFYGESSEYTYNKQKTQGHVVLITRNENNDIVWYDPQNGERYEGAVDVRDYLNSWVNERTMFEPRFLRVDDKAFNPKYTNKVVRKR